MIRPLLAALLLTFGLNPGWAQTNVFIATGGVPVSAGLCPQGTSSPDGCAGANPLSAFQVQNAFARGGVFNTLTGSTTDYSTTNIETAGVNSAGVDYPVANYTPISAMADPLVGLVGLGCTQTTFNVAGNPILICGAGFTSNRIGEYDFKARFGHPCVILNVTGAAAPIGGKLDVQDNNFENDGSCGLTPGNDVIASVGDLSYETDVTFNSFNGHGTTFPYSNCGKIGFPGTNPCNAVTALNTEGVVKIEYNSFVDWSGRPLGCIVSGTNPALNSLTFKFNYVQGWDYEPFNGHAEFILCNNLTTNPVIGLEDYGYNTVVNTTDAMQFGPSPFWVASTDYLSANAINIVGNTVLSSLVGNSTYSATVSGCIGASMSGGVCSGPGSNFYAISVSSGDRIGHGEEVGGTQGGALCATSSGTMTVTSITAPSSGASTLTVTGSPTIGLIPGYTISMSSGYGTNAMTISSQLTATGNILGGAGTYRVTNTNTGSFSGSATATTPGGQVVAWLSQNLGGGQGSGSSWTISSGTNPPGNWLAGPATCTGLSFFGPSANIPIAAIGHMQNLGALTITGNYADSVPTFAQRGNPFFTIGGTSSQSIICGVPSTVTDNHDMAGIAGSTITNPSLGSSSFTSGC